MKNTVGKGRMREMDWTVRQLIQVARAAREVVATFDAVKSHPNNRTGSRHQAATERLRSALALGGADAPQVEDTPPSEQETP